jgi:DNA polymerase-3 subunit gamma/tau
MRDAMSLLDQVLAYNAQALRADDVAKVLGVASHQVLYSLAGDLLLGNAEGCVRAVTELSNQGFNIASVARDLLSLLRDMVICKVCDKPQDLLDLPDQEQKDVQQLSSQAQADDLVRLHQGFSRGFDDVLRGGQPRAALEMLLIRLARRPALIPIEEWMSRLSALEHRLGSGASSAGGSGGGTGGGAQQVTPRAAVAAASSPAPARRAEGAQQPAPPQTAPSTQSMPSAQPMSSAQPGQPTQPVRAMQPTQPMPATQNGAKGAAVPAGAMGSASGNSNLELWSTLLDQIREGRPELASVLQHVVPLRIDAQEMQLGIEKGSVFEQKLNSSEVHQLLKKVATAHFNSTPKISVQASAALAGEQTLAAMAADARAARKQAATERAQQHPKVLEAIEILGGRIKEVRPAED